MDTAYYDLKVLKEIKKRRHKEITARGIQRIIESSEKKVHEPYRLDAISGVVTHKFSSAYYRPLHEAVRFASQPQTKLVPIRVTTSTPIWHWFVDEKLKTMKKLFPGSKKSRDGETAFTQATATLTAEEIESRHLTSDEWWQRQIISAISFNFISTGFLAAGINSFIAVSDDMFLMLEEDLDTAFNVIETVADELDLEDILFFRTEK